MYISSIVALAVRGAGAFVGILVTITTARLLSMEEAGSFLFCMTVIQSLGGVLCLGTYTAALKTSASLSKLGWEVTNRKISIYLYIVTFFYLIIFLIYFFVQSNTLYGLKGRQDILLTLIGLMAFSLNTLFSSCWQGAQKTLYASLLQNTLVPIIYIFQLIFIYLLDINKSATNLLSAYVISICVVTLLGAYSWYSQSSAKLYLEHSIDNALLKRLSSFALIVLMNSTIIWSSQYAVATYLGDLEFALFNAAQRLAMLIGIVAVAVNFVVSPLFAKAQVGDDYNSLRLASLKGIRISMIMATPMLIFILIFPSIPLSLFGSSYGDAANFLRILALCQFINIITGPTASLLTMTGYEKDLKNILLVIGIFACTTTFLLAYFFGVVGALIASLSTFSAQSVLVAYFVYKRLGFTPFFQLFNK